MANPKPSPKGQFKPGTTGNPNGRPSVLPELRALKRMTVQEYQLAVNTLLTATEKDINKVNNDPEASFVQRIICQILQRIYETGDVAKFDLLLTRLLGKVKDQVEVEVVRPSILVRRNGDEVHFTMQKITDEDDEA